MFQKGDKKTEMSNIDDNNRFGIQVMYGRLCYYTAFTIFRDEETFTFTQNLNINNSIECQTAIKTNYNM